ncbi:hypothetical protein VM98_38610, partial [Streptomyces rubellomurinus subsp. indigoferus]
MEQSQPSPSGAPASTPAQGPPDTAPPPSRAVPDDPPAPPAARDAPYAAGWLRRLLGHRSPSRRSPPPALGASLLGIADPALVPLVTKLT